MKRSLMEGGVDISLPNVSYCEDVKDVHYNPYSTVEFYVGEITGTTPQTVKIYTSEYTSVNVQVSEENKWYTYVLPKDKGLYNISGNTVTKVRVKADISFYGDLNHGYFSIIPKTTIEASFKGSNTSNVTSMAHMFYNHGNIESLDLSGWDTSKVIYMNNMFYFCTSLTSLDVSSFDTSNVTNMYSMFAGCSGLKSLDVGSFDTSNVTDMNNMFGSCSGLTSLDLSNFKTSKVTSMSNMFNGCSSLISLDLSGFDMSKVDRYLSGMFKSCIKLKTIRMVDCGQTTIDKIKAQLTKSNITGVTIVTE